MKKYNKETMVDRLLSRLEQGEDICVWDFPNYDEHFVTEIEEILDIVDEYLELNDRRVNRSKAPSCGWGMASYKLLSLEK